MLRTIMEIVTITTILRPWNLHRCNLLITVVNTTQVRRQRKQYFGVRLQKVHDSETAVFRLTDPLPTYTRQQRYVNPEYLNDGVIAAQSNSLAYTLPREYLNFDSLIQLTIPM